MMMGIFVVVHIIIRIIDVGKDTEGINSKY